MSGIIAAATNLQMKLFGRAERDREPLAGLIVIDPLDEAPTLRVHLHAHRHPQHEPPFHEWQGFPVEWNYGVPRP